MNATALIPRAGVDEIVGWRDQAVALYQRYFEAIEAAHQIQVEAEDATRKACLGLNVGSPYSDKYRKEIEAFRASIQMPNVSECLSTAIRLLDIRVWSALIEHTGLEALMDKKAKDELRKQLEFVPERTPADRWAIIPPQELSKGLPPVTVENVLGTLQGFAEDHETIFKRGIANAFSELDPRFKSHDGFKVGSRMIITGAFNSWGSWCYHRNGRDVLIDIERAFLVLDGKPPTSEARARKAAMEAAAAGEQAVPSYVGIVAQVTAERHSTPRRSSLTGFQSEHEGDYFKVRVFKNGNAHLWFTRDDLVEKVNLLLADYYGAGLGYGRDTYDEDGNEATPRPDLFATAIERAPAKNFGLFPTPDRLADQVIALADLHAFDRRLHVLEPSAGTGQLARRAALHTPSWIPPGKSAHGCAVTCVEIQEGLAQLLAAETTWNGHERVATYARVLCRDFLALSPSQTYDRILMNPPFDRGRDLDHLSHALKFLAPDGVLVAITSASARYGNSPKATALRQVLETRKHRWHDLPPGSFAQAGTNVNACILVIGHDRWVSL